ncbi:hypothetical protein A1D25_02240 [Ursidibacter arcticus]|uniref:hypothetical protein n=1 Tax=Ursidibacter arcticus TaxID=1524965 RepID=UPI0012FB01D2|nr:hypothetical protein [Ursidibacter arcticus]KAE9531178.1 hypothetical protein A1D25_02240 [Ursidibacter arcticus]
MNKKEQKNNLINTLKQQYLSVGILSSNWFVFKQQLDILSDKNINILHFDIADGNFSPLFTVGPMAIKQFNDHFFKDVHLMVKDQQTFAKSCVENGANLVTLQVEQQEGLSDTIEWLSQQQNLYLGKNEPVLIGLSICPKTDINLLSCYVEKVDVFQILTLDPRTGEKYSKEYIENRVSLLNQLLGKDRILKLINIDGSMNLDLAQYLNRNQSIDWFVSGSALFSEDLHNSLCKWEILKY